MILLRTKSGEHLPLMVWTVSSADIRALSIDLPWFFAIFDSAFLQILKYLRFERFNLFDDNDVDLKIYTKWYTKIIKKT